MFRSTMPGFGHPPHHPPGSRGRRRVTFAAVGVAGSAVLAFCCAGCAASAASAAPTAAATGTATAAAAAASAGPRGSASVGPITVTDAYIPQPATPDVAAAYFTVTEHGGQGDVLLSASSVPASQAALMQESQAGQGAESMTTLPHGLPIPAQTSVVLGPGGYHLMLTDPAVRLTAGGSVTLTLRFQHAGSVTFRVPVTSLLSDAVTAPETSTSPGMGSMPGM